MRNRNLRWGPGCLDYGFWVASRVLSIEYLTAQFPKFACRYPFKDLNYSSLDGNSKRRRITPCSLLAEKVCQYLPAPKAPGQKAPLVAWLAHWFASYPLPGCYRQGQLQVPRAFHPCSGLTWLQVTAGISSPRTQNLAPEAYTTEKETPRLKSLPSISFHPFLQSLLHWIGTFPVRPASQTTEGSCSPLAVTERDSGMWALSVHTAVPVWQPAVRDGPACPL